MIIDGNVVLFRFVCPSWRLTWDPLPLHPSLYGSVMTNVVS